MLPVGVAGGTTGGGFCTYAACSCMMGDGARSSLIASLPLRMVCDEAWKARSLRGVGLRMGGGCWGFGRRSLASALTMVNVFFF